MFGAVRYCHAAIPRARMSPANVVVPEVLKFTFPETVRFETFVLPRVASVAKRFVEDAVDEKRLVVVAFVVVEFVAVRPVIVAKVDVKVSIVPENALKIDEKNEVVVAFVPVAFVNIRLLIVPFPAKRFVDVLFEVVELPEFVLTSVRVPALRLSA